jgi:acetyl-CoA carboxylase carboxyltransferase component
MTVATPVVDLRAGTTGAVTARAARATDRAVIEIEIGPSAKLGALSLRDGEKLADAVRTATEQRLPLLAHVASTGALVGDGIAASHGWGTAARELVRASGVIPLLFSVEGPAVSGIALLLGLADHVVFTTDAYAFVTGPRIVTQVTGVSTSAEALGGAGAHDRRTGLASLVAAGRDDARLALHDLLAYLPDDCDELPPCWPTDDPADRPTPEAGDLIPASPTGAYDVRQVVAALADDGEVLEVRAGWAPNLVTAFTTLGGRPVGVLANQPTSIAGTLDIPASQKGARFVAFCDAFNLPLVTLVDTPGFYPGKDLEWRGMIRHGAQLAFAYARATVPRVSVTLRKSYGGAYIVMDSKTMGSDLSLAWPSAEIAVMGAQGAVEILHRRASDEERAQAQLDYEEHLLNPYIAAERGLVDAVVEPAETRRVLCEALAALDTKREHLAPRGHDNTPL